MPPTPKYDNHALKRFCIEAGLSSSGKPNKALREILRDADDSVINKIWSDKFSVGLVRDNVEPLVKYFSSKLERDYEVEYFIAPQGEQTSFHVLRKPSSSAIGRKTKVPDALKKYSPIVQIVGLPGSGKTATVWNFAELLEKNDVVVVWYSLQADLDINGVFREILDHLKFPLHGKDETKDCGEIERRRGCIAQLIQEGINGKPFVLILNGVDQLEYAIRETTGAINDEQLAELVGELRTQRMDVLGSLILTSGSRLEIADAVTITMDGLDPDDIQKHFDDCLVTIAKDTASAICDMVDGYPLAIDEVAKAKSPGSKSLTIDEFQTLLTGEPTSGKEPPPIVQVAKELFQHITDTRMRQMLVILAYCDLPVPDLVLAKVLNKRIQVGSEIINSELEGKDFTPIPLTTLKILERRGFVRHVDGAGWTLKPLIKVAVQHYHSRKWTQEGDYKKAICTELARCYSDELEKSVPNTVRDLDVAFCAYQYTMDYGNLSDAYRIYEQHIRRVWVENRNLIVDETSSIFRPFFDQILKRGFRKGDFSRDPWFELPAHRARFLADAAKAHEILGSPRDAMLLYERCRQLWLDLEDWERASKAWFGLAGCYICLGRLSAALDAVNKAGEYAEEIGDIKTQQDMINVAIRFEAMVFALRGDQGRLDKLQGNQGLILVPANSLLSVYGFRWAMWLAIVAREFVSKNTKLTPNQVKKQIAQHFDNAFMFIDQYMQAVTKPGSRRELLLFGLASKAMVTRLAIEHDPRGKWTRDDLLNVLDGMKDSELLRNGYFEIFANCERGRSYAFLASISSGKDRTDHIKDAEDYLKNSVERATLKWKEKAFYRLVLADAHIGMATLAKIRNKPKKVKEHCDAARKICDRPAIDYAWARFDADRL